MAHYNGGSIIAMIGKDCVAIACDTYLSDGRKGVTADYQRVFPITDRIYVGFSGLATDCITLRERIRFRTNLYSIKEERDLEPRTFTHLLSSMLYEHRFASYLVSPVVAGLETTPSGKVRPFVAGTDSIGAIGSTNSFSVVGIADDEILGAAEGLWEPDLEPEDLFETISQALLSGVDRVTKAGWGAEVHVITKDAIITRTLRTRKD